MKKMFNYIILAGMLIMPASVYAWGLSWNNLWQTRDQQGARLLQAGKSQEASRVFKNADWRAVALYRSKNYAQAFEKFSPSKISDGQYNAGNAAAWQGKYERAIKAYDKAIALNANNNDAITNREIIKKLLEKQKQQQNNSADNKDKDKNKSNSNAQSGQQNSPTGKSAENKPDNSVGKSNHSQPSPTPDDKSSSASSQSRAQDEDNKQLLRRLDDDPGGLLQQKFLRDYYRRHAENVSQGDTNAR